MSRYRIKPPWAFSILKTLKLSSDNDWLLEYAEEETRTLALNENNTVICSKVSPFTVTKRTELKKDVVWRRDND